ncbi:NAD-dependent epimerase/dehydratase family protein [Nonomuraea rhodomycinica]|uniref:NAD(P)-dependent oxidoreductase n=1 Tax=Nonomuraea rhodomycinica TaxID=1712872 RepID=A0A7Y6MEZ2_9ACTN|nr:NAD(P)-dependent oxidoreductase [Nonomuraea rhodomycinica]NUW46083.1 NAD(P)-dependent oxidoreductase [Nonomuraea rhodomycinica]
MNVLLAGATGTLGSILVRRLLAAGHQVCGITRSAAGARRLADAGATAVVADVMDRDALLTALDGLRADAVVHQATAITGLPLFHRALYATDALRERGTAHLVEAAGLVGAGRFLTQSFFLGYGYRDHGEALVTEDRPFAEPGQGAFDPHMRAMRANEEQVFAIGGVSLRYGMFYGPEPATANLLRMAGKRMLPVPRPASTVSLVHVEDAAAATVAALERGRPGRAYNVADDHPVRFDEYVRALARAAGGPAPLTVPGGLLRVTPYLHALMVGTRLRLSTALARSELGWTPAYPSYREGLACLGDLLLGRPGGRQTPNGAA